MRIKYVVIAPEEVLIVGSRGCALFKGRTPREAVKRHDAYFRRRDELFGKCKCIIGTIFEGEGGKKTRKETGEVWKKDMMIFEIQMRGYKKKRFISKKNECPFEFLARIIKTCKQWNGDAVWNYLRYDMREGVKK